MKKTITSLLVASTLTVAATTASAGALDKENFSANIALTSDYLFRGISLSNEDPAVSGGFDWSYNGFYLGTWASSISAVENESFEIDYLAGYTGSIGGFSYSLDYIYYDYPGDKGTLNGNDLDYQEYGGSLGYTFGGDMEPTISLAILHSNDFFNETGSATAYMASFGLSLPYGLSFGATLGNQDLDKKKTGISDYDYYDVSLSKTIGIADVTLGYSDTDKDGETFAGVDTDTFYITVGSSW